MRDCCVSRTLTVYVCGNESFRELVCFVAAAGNATCIPSIGMFLFEDTKLNYSNAYNACISAGGSLAHIASDARTFQLSKYIASLPETNYTTNNSTDTTSAIEPLYYVGLNETVKNRFFSSADERLDCFRFRAWAPGHPA